ncbi:MAG: cytochrome c3 family protein [Gemmatimonadota bacterium]
MKRSALATGVLVLALACGPPPDAADGSEEAGSAPATTVEDAPADQAPTGAEASLAGLSDFRSASARIASDFPHDRHVGVGCAECHPDPPGHGTHGMVECAECHDAPAGATAARVQEGTGCMGCHHAPDRAGPCTTCHGPASALPAVEVSVRMRVAGSTDRPARSLLFRHELHSAPACTDCHRGGDTFAVERGCSSCHERHHRPDADCLACHTPLPMETHAAGVHDGCSGTTCHTDPVVTALPQTRSLCLVCHQDQIRHMPGEECAGCHQVGDDA